ncbi:hypothetical protein B296_00047251 [Ensete ventricosum]|uniref:Uncharacterized protein n=1 Tax=Ensete ventricosum TaxID=4639 RepID=A0A426X4F3_ENSVE|nr:hypothetical protein B296_00047251 [Ensete ventricosum]
MMPGSASSRTSKSRSRTSATNPTSAFFKNRPASYRQPQPPKFLFLFRSFILDVASFSPHGENKSGRQEITAGD